MFRLFYNTRPYNIPNKNHVLNNVFWEKKRNDNSSTSFIVKTKTKAMGFEALKVKQNLLVVIQRYKPGLRILGIIS